MQPTCPECGARMVLRRTYKYLYPNGDPRKFWGCSSYPRCQAAHGAHPDGRPLGDPADRPTRRARQHAHSVFDLLWRSGRYTRKEAYTKLAELMGLTRDRVHFGSFTLQQCERAIGLIGDLGGEPQAKIKTTANRASVDHHGHGVGRRPAPRDYPGRNQLGMEEQPLHRTPKAD